MSSGHYALERDRIRVGTVSARYFRENAAQAGLDLQQILPELITNADAAISASGRAFGQIKVAFADPDTAFARAWRRETRRLRVPYSASWKAELRCIDNGVGVTADIIQSRLARLGATPDHRGQRGLFGRGLREVWLAQGGGRVIGIRDGRLVEAWFFLHETQAFAFQVVRDEEATQVEREELGLPGDGTSVFVPMDLQPPSPGRLRRLLSDHVQLRPILEDPERDVWLQVEDSIERVVYSPPEPDPHRPVLFDGVVTVGEDHEARVVVRRSSSPFAANVSRSLRRGGLLIRSGRAAHESTLGRFENRPGAQHLYGDVRLEAIESVQRTDLEATRPELVVRVDRSGLNEHHPLVAGLYRCLDEMLEPIVLDEERRAGASRVEVAAATRSRDMEGLRALNRVLRHLFKDDGAAPASPGGHAADSPPAHEPEQLRLDDRPRAEDKQDDHAPPSEQPALYFKRSPMRLHPTESRDVMLMADAAVLPLDAEIRFEVDGPVKARAVETRRSRSARAGERWSVPVRVRARASAKPGARPLVTARVGNFTALLDIVIVSHRASGWVTEIVRKDETAPIEAEFDPTTGTVVVYEGRPEFRKLEAAARAHGYKKGRYSEFVPFRMLEVEAAANAVYHWAARELVRRRVTEEQPMAPEDYAAAVRSQSQELRRQSHAQLMQAFLPAEVFEPAERLRVV